MSLEQTTPHGERKHHRNSPSTLQPTEVCPGYKSESGTTNEKAAMGTMLHEACEGGPTDHLTDEQLERVNACKAYVQEIVDGYLAAFPGAGVMTITGTERTTVILKEPTIPGAGFVRIIREAYLHIDDKDTSAGYLDVGIIAPDFKSAHIVDFKFGDNPVEKASNNLQGISYLLGVFREFAPDLDLGTVHFLMPYQATNLDKHTFLRVEFNGFLLRVQTVVARARLVASYFTPEGIFVGPPEVEAMLNPSEGTCLFCARKAGCPAAAKAYLQTGKKYDPLIVPRSLNPLELNDPVEAGKALKFLATMEAVGKAVRAKITERATNEDNFMPAGFQLVLMERRAIVDKKKFYETIKPILTEEEMIQCIDFTFGPIEKLVSAKAARGSKKEAVEELKQLLAMNGATEVGEPIAILKQRKVAAIEAV